MGLIKEPKGVDFIINSKPLTEEEEKQLSEFIAKRKREIAKTKHQGPTNKSKRTSKAKPNKKNKEKT